MANTDRPFTKYYNDLLEASIAAELGGREYQVFLVILRDTIGWGKDEVELSLGDFRDRCHFTGKNDNSIRHNVMRVIACLQEKRIINVRQLPGVPGFYSINQNVSEWKVSPVTCNSQDTCNSKVTCNPQVTATCNSEDTCSGNVQVTGSPDIHVYKEKEKKDKEIESIPPVVSNQTCCPLKREIDSNFTPKPLDKAKYLMHDVWKEVFPHAVCYDFSKAGCLSQLINKGMMPQQIADAFRYWLKHASDNEQMAGYPIGWFVTAVPAISAKVNQPAPESDFERSLRKQEEREAKQAWIDNRSNEIVAEKQLPYPEAREIAVGEWEAQYGIRAA
jgi:phage replication O-like protein O